MDRRTLLVGAAVAVAATTAGAPAAASASRPAGAAPVLLYDETAGFGPPGVNEIDAADLVVYADGTVITEARYAARLDRATVGRLVRSAVPVLRDPANAALYGALPMIAGAPISRFQARLGGHPYALDVYAMKIYRADHGYPPAGYRLLDSLMHWQQWVLVHGRPYQPAAVRLVVVPIDHPTVPAPAWPVGVPVPALDRRTAVATVTTVTTVERYGPAARAVAAAFPPDSSHDWPAYRTPTGTGLLVAWRRLLPHEMHRPAATG